MNAATYRDRKTLLIISFSGFLLWLIGAAYFGVTGTALIEGPLWFYGFNAAVAACVWGMMFRVLAKALRAPRRLWAAAAAAFALPGLLLEVAVLINLDTLFAEAPPATLGRYAGLVAFAFLILPAFAWPQPALIGLTARRAARPAR